MSPKNPTDRFFREKLGNYVSKPPMHVWEQIDRKRTRRHILLNWFKQRKMLVLLALLLASGVAYWSVSEGSGNSGNQLSDKGVLTDVGQKSPENIASSNSDIFKKQEKEAAEKNGSKIERSQTNSLETKQMRNDNLAPNPSLNRLASESFSKKPPLNPPIANQSVAGDVGNDAAEIQPLSAAAGMVQSLKLTAPSKLTFLPGMISPLSIEEPVFNLPAPDLPKMEKKRRFTVYLDVLASPEFSIRSLESRSPDNLSYKDARANTESTRYAFSGGLRLSFVGKRGFAFRTGLMYAQINERFDFQNENAERRSLINTFDMRGNIIGTDTLLATGFRQKRTYNRFHLIDIPVLAGYELNTRRWTFSLNGGLYFNLLFHKKGDLLSPENEPATFSSGAADALPVFKSRAGISLFSSFGLNYKFSKNVHWVIEPQLRYYLNPLTREDYLLEQKYLSAGLLTGLRFKF